MPEYPALVHGKDGGGLRVRSAAGGVAVRFLYTRSAYLTSSCESPVTRGRFFRLGEQTSVDRPTGKRSLRNLYSCKTRLNKMLRHHPVCMASFSGTPVANGLFMQTTLNTSIAAMMCDNLQSDGGDRSGYGQFRKRRRTQSGSVVNGTAAVSDFYAVYPAHSYDR